MTIIMVMARLEPFELIYASVVRDHLRYIERKYHTLIREAIKQQNKKTEKELERSDGEPESTNNKMELTAVIRGLEALTEPCEVTLYADSSYVLQGMSSWMKGWKNRGWKRKEGSRLVPVKNVELWKRLDELLQVHQVTCEHVKGHAGHLENERCDQLAVAAYQRYLEKS